MKIDRDIFKSKMVSDEFKNDLRKYLNSTKIDSFSVYTDTATITFLDNDDDCEYDIDKMLQNLEIESCDVSDRDNEHQKEKLYIAYKNLLEFKKGHPKEKFMVFLGTPIWLKKF